jgi:hypothetical protein
VEVRVLFGACEKAPLRGAFCLPESGRPRGEHFAATPWQLENTLRSPRSLRAGGAMSVHYDRARERWVVRWPKADRQRARRSSPTPKRGCWMSGCRRRGPILPLCSKRLLATAASTVRDGGRDALAVRVGASRKEPSLTAGSFFPEGFSLVASGPPGEVVFVELEQVVGRQAAPACGCLGSNTLQTRERAWATESAFADGTDQRRQPGRRSPGLAARYVRRSAPGGCRRRACRAR